MKRRRSRGLTGPELRIYLYLSSFRVTVLYFTISKVCGWVRGVALRLPDEWVAAAHPHPCRAIHPARLWVWFTQSININTLDDTAQIESLILIPNINLNLNLPVKHMHMLG